MSTPDFMSVKRVALSPETPGRSLCQKETKINARQREETLTNVVVCVKRNP